VGTKLESLKVLGKADPADSGEVLGTERIVSQPFELTRAMAAACVTIRAAVT
jgi:hypothetical protein